VAELVDDERNLIVWLAAGVVPDQRRATRLLLDHALAELGSPLRSETCLFAEPSGRPVLRGANAPQVSISHAYGLIAVAVARTGGVGVDVEGLRPLPALALARRWFLEEEAGWLSAQPEELRGRGFLWLWTQKEAMGKALGIGLRDGCTRIAVPGLGTRPLLATGRRLTPRATGVPVTVVPGPAHFVIAAAATHCGPVEVRNVTVDRLGAAMRH
jgi:4'-phosphopantetheinyl transferase